MYIIVKSKRPCASVWLEQYWLSTYGVQPLCLSEDPNHCVLQEEWRLAFQNQSMGRLYLFILIQLFVHSIQGDHYSWMVIENKCTTFPQQRDCTEWTTRHPNLRTKSRGDVFRPCIHSAMVMSWISYCGLHQNVGDSSADDWSVGHIATWICHVSIILIDLGAKHFIIMSLLSSGRWLKYSCLFWPRFDRSRACQSTWWFSSRCLDHICRSTMCVSGNGWVSLIFQEIIFYMYQVTRDLPFLEFKLSCLKKLKTLLWSSDTAWVQQNLLIGCLRFTLL